MIAQLRGEVLNMFVSHRVHSPPPPTPASLQVKQRSKRPYVCSRTSLCECALMEISACLFVCWLVPGIRWLGMFIFGYVSVCDCVFVPKSNWYEVCAKNWRVVGQWHVCLWLCLCVLVSLCLCVCVWYKFCAKLMGGWSCLSVANHRTGPTSASSSANYNWCNIPAASSTRSSDIGNSNYHTIDVTYPGFIH